MVSNAVTAVILSKFSLGKENSSAGAWNLLDLKWLKWFKKAKQFISRNIVVSYYVTNLRAASNSQQQCCDSFYRPRRDGRLSEPWASGRSRGRLVVRPEC